MNLTLFALSLLFTQVLSQEAGTCTTNLDCPSGLRPEGIKAQSYHFAAFVPGLTIDQVWEVVDFGSPLYGSHYFDSALEVPAVRGLQNPTKTKWINETQVARDIASPVYKTYTYTLAYPNTYSFWGYRSKVEVFAGTEGAPGTFLQWTASWEGGNEEAPKLLARIQGVVGNVPPLYQKLQAMLAEASKPQ